LFYDVSLSELSSKEEAITCEIYNLRSAESDYSTHADCERMSPLQPTETSPLLLELNDSVEDTNLHGGGYRNNVGEEAVKPRNDHTTRSREIQILCFNSAPLIMTFLLQHSINMASIFAAGQIGKVELSAVTCGFPMLFVPKS